MRQAIIGGFVDIYQPIANARYARRRAFLHLPKDEGRYHLIETKKYNYIVAQMYLTKRKRTNCCPISLSPLIQEQSPATVPGAIKLVDCSFRSASLYYSVAWFLPVKASHDSQTSNCECKVQHIKCFAA